MQSLFVVFLGGGLGSVIRFSLGKWVNSLHNQPFPFGTFAVNIIACLTLGIIVGLADHRQLFSPNARLFWTVGFCGGFSTFSAFSNEALRLIQSGSILYALLYILLSIVLGISVLYVGAYIANILK